MGIQNGHWSGPSLNTSRVGISNHAVFKNQFEQGGGSLLGSPQGISKHDFHAPGPFICGGKGYSVESRFHLDIISSRYPIHGPLVLGGLVDTTLARKSTPYIRGLRTSMGVATSSATNR